MTGVFRVAPVVSNPEVGNPEILRRFHQGIFLDSLVSYLSRNSDTLHMCGGPGGKRRDHRARDSSKRIHVASRQSSKYGTSHISDVPLDLVNNSISGLTSENFCRITNLRIFGPARPPPAMALSTTPRS